MVEAKIKNPLNENQTVNEIISALDKEIIENVSYYTLIVNFQFDKKFESLTSDKLKALGL